MDGNSNHFWGHEKLPDICYGCNFKFTFTRNLHQGWCKDIYLVLADTIVGRLDLQSATPGYEKEWCRISGSRMTSFQCIIFTNYLKSPTKLCFFFIALEIVLKTVSSFSSFILYSMRQVLFVIDSTRRFEHSFCFWFNLVRSNFILYFHFNCIHKGQMSTWIWKENYSAPTDLKLAYN